MLLGPEAKTARIATSPDETKAMMAELKAKLEARMAAEAGHGHRPILLVVDDFELVQAMTPIGQSLLGDISAYLLLAGRLSFSVVVNQLAGGSQSRITDIVHAPHVRIGPVAHVLQLRLARGNPARRVPGPKAPARPRGGHPDRLPRRPGQHPEPAVTDRIVHCGPSPLDQTRGLLQRSTDLDTPRRRLVMRFQDCRRIRTRTRIWGRPHTRDGQGSPRMAARSSARLAEAMSHMA